MTKKKRKTTSIRFSIKDKKLQKNNIQSKTYAKKKPFKNRQQTEELKKNSNEIKIGTYENKRGEKEMRHNSRAIVCHCFWVVCQFSVLISCVQYAAGQIVQDGVMWSVVQRSVIYECLFQLYWLYKSKAPSTLLPPYRPANSLYM